MANHWTYHDVETEKDLTQGDIISRSEPLVNILSEYHSHFCNEKYLGFLVVTQTCDLVRRNHDSPSAKYITISAIRSLADVLPSLLNDINASRIEGLYFKEKHELSKQLLERIFNQNEQALGLFYLHPDADIGIVLPSVALLRITIALRIEHYDVLQESRTGSLRPQFSNKLGWLCGNLFSRVPTPDWKDHRDSQSEYHDLVENSLSGWGDYHWVEHAWLKNALKENSEILQMPAKEAAGEVEKHAPPLKREIILSRIREITEEFVIDRSGEYANEIAFQIKKDGKFSTSLESILREFAENLLNKSPDVVQDQHLEQCIADVDIQQALFDRLNEMGPDVLKGRIISSLGKLIKRVQNDPKIANLIKG